MDKSINWYALIFALVCQIFACVQSSKCNRFLDNYSSEITKKDGRKIIIFPHAPFIEMIFTIICLIAVIFSLI